MADLQVSSGLVARSVLCAAFDGARESINAEFYKLSDPQVVASLNAAAARGVRVSVELEGAPDRYQRFGHKAASASGASADSIAAIRAQLSPLVQLDVANDPMVLLHAKAALVDDTQALISTANQTPSGFCSPGEVLICDTNPADVAAVHAALVHKDAEEGPQVVSGPGPRLRERIDPLFASSSDLSIAIEDISDALVVDQLEARRQAGHHDRLLVNAYNKVSLAEARVIRELEGCGVAVRALPKQYMHEKYIDAGTQIYVGSANLTRNGLDEAREVAVVAAPAAYNDNAAALRTGFEYDWRRAKPVTLRGCVVQALETAA